MSTSEKWTDIYSPCPCGNGNILQHWDSPDNPWSKTTSRYELNCQECSTRWILVDRRLHDRVAYEDNKRALNNAYEASKKLETAGKQAIDLILTDMATGTHKEEYSLLKAAGVCFEGPIRYKRFRSGGKVASEMCRPTANIDWIVANLRDEALRDRINSIRLEIDGQETIQKDAQRRFATIIISSLKTAAP